MDFFGKKLATLCDPSYQAPSLGAKFYDQKDFMFKFCLESASSQLSPDKYFVSIYFHYIFTKQVQNAVDSARESRKEHNDRMDNQLW